MTIQPTWPARNISLRQWITIYIWDIPAFLQFMVHHTFSHHPTTHNQMVKWNILWIPLNVFCSKQKEREHQPRRYWIHFSFDTEQHQMLPWKMKYLLQKHLWDESSRQHWILCTNKNKDKNVLDQHTRICKKLLV